jgi:hypothetical protein
MNEQDQIKAAKERASKLASFYRHLTIYAVSIMALAVVDALSNPSEWFVQWVALIWGFVILKRAWCAFGANALFDKNWEERKTAEILGGKPKRKNRDDYFDESVLE